MFFLRLTIPCRTALKKTASVSSMKLSEALVLAKTKVESVDQVRNLNLWGNGLTDVEVSGRGRAVVLVIVLVIVRPTCGKKKKTTTPTTTTVNRLTSSSLSLLNVFL